MAARFFTKPYTHALKGLCLIPVLLVHIPQAFQNPVQDALGSFAYIAVTLFFAISAYGMQCSADGNPGYLHHFWRNRLSSLLVPCISINVISFVAAPAMGIETKLTELLFINRYVLVLLEYCLVFYVVKKTKLRNEIAVLCLSVLVSSLSAYFIYGDSMPPRWPYERLGLVWGLLLYEYEDKLTAYYDKHLSSSKLALFLFSLLSGIAYLFLKPLFFWGGYILKIILGLAAILLFASLTYRISDKVLKNSLFVFLGDVSFEVYLSQGLVMSLLSISFPSISSWTFIILAFLFSFILSYIVSVFDRKVVSLMRKA